MSKLINKLVLMIAVLTLGLLPWGQIPGLVIDLTFRLPFTIHPLDLLSVTTIPISLFIIIVRRKIIKYIPYLSFATVALLSFVPALFSAPAQQIMISAFYLIRLISYISLSVVFAYSVEEKLLKKATLLDSLIAVGIIVAVIGWIQYVLAPDLRFMSILGWDDHYFRISSSFLDPSFAGLILSLSFVILLQRLRTSTNMRAALVAGFILLTIVFTYSRASYLSFIVGSSYFVFNKISPKLLLKITGVIILIFVLLPKPGGEGVNLLRTRSIGARARNYAETIEIFKQRPILGVGFNNICGAKKARNPNLESHNSCSGADNSFLFILATTGIIGAAAFAYSSRELVIQTNKGKYGQVFKASMLIVATHSLFSNSIFYMSTMTWFAILVSLSRKREHFTESN